MVYISKVYTRSGDDGATMLATGDRVGKDHQRIRSYGDVDELNATVGMLRAELARSRCAAANEELTARIDDELGRIQQELFNLGAELSTPMPQGETPKLAVHETHVTRLEQEIDAHNDVLEPLRSFVLPGPSAVASVCHLARTVCRRAEREIVALSRIEPVREAAIHYVNRLSDYLFVLSRSITHAQGDAEVLWDPKSV
jgi:cob(I)alamin adenosyltransferase